MTDDLVQRMDISVTEGKTWRATWRNQDVSRGVGRIHLGSKDPEGCRNEGTSDQETSGDRMAGGGGELLSGSGTRSGRTRVRARGEAPDPRRLPRVPRASKQNFQHEAAGMGEPHRSERRRQSACGRVHGPGRARRTIRREFGLGGFAARSAHVGSGGARQGPRSKLLSPPKRDEAIPGAARQAIDSYAPPPAVASVERSLDAGRRATSSLECRAADGCASARACSSESPHILDGDGWGQAP